MGAGIERVLENRKRASFAKEVIGEADLDFGLMTFEKETAQHQAVETYRDHLPLTWQKSPEREPLAGKLSWKNSIPRTGCFFL